MPGANSCWTGSAIRWNSLTPSFIDERERRAVGGDDGRVARLACGVGSAPQRRVPSVGGTARAPCRRRAASVVVIIGSLSFGAATDGSVPPTARSSRARAIQ